LILDRLRASLADRCRLERELGQGGMATVYRAEDLKHHHGVIRRDNQAGSGAGRDGHGPARAR
jgi:hypothetical protein